MTLQLSGTVTLGLSLALAGCLSSRPVIDTSSGPTTQEGTIAGHVRTDGDDPIVSRMVRAVPADGSTPYETTTSGTGSYTLKVRPGRYRMEVELRSGERVVKEPGVTDVNPSDLDPDRDFVLTVSR